MPRFVAVGLLLVGLVSAWADAARLTKEPKGFNGYTWGASPAEYPALKLLSNPALANPLPFVQVYENPGEVLLLNGVTMSQVYYRFYKGRLGNIQLAYNGRKDREKILKWIEENYGQMPLAEHRQKQIEWHGENVVITLEYDVTTGQGRLWFTYLALSTFDNSTTDTTGY